MKEISLKHTSKKFCKQKKFRSSIDPRDRSVYEELQFFLQVSILDMCFSKILVSFICRNGI